MKNSDVTEQEIWSQIWWWETKNLIFDIKSLQNGKINLNYNSKTTTAIINGKNYDVTPLILLRDSSGKIQWSHLNAISFNGTVVNQFPFLLSYFCYIVAWFWGKGW